MTKLHIPKSERDLVRVFALSMSEVEAGALRNNDDIASLDDPHPQEKALGANFVDGNMVEVFPIADLDTLGLADYLIQGFYAQPEAIEPDRTKLTAIDGWVMLVHSAAFGGVEQTISPSAALTLVGTYPLIQADMSVTPILSEAAQPYTGVPSPTPPTPPNGRAGGSLVVVGLTVMAALILWWAFN